MNPVLELGLDRNGHLSSLSPIRSLPGRGVLRRIERGGTWKPAGSALHNEVNRREMAHSFANRLLADLNIRVGCWAYEGVIHYFIWIPK